MRCLSFKYTCPQEIVNDLVFRSWWQQAFFYNVPIEKLRKYYPEFERYEEKCKDDVAKLVR